MWLAGKLNEIKQKYRELATACLLRTRLAFVSEVQKYYQTAKLAIGQLGDDSNTVQLQAVNSPLQQQQQLSMVQSDSEDAQKQLIENRAHDEE